MAGILANLGGNPLNTPVGQKIEQATDASLPSENWALNMEICDFINETDEGPKDAVKAIRKRLQQNTGKNYTVVLYTLTVLETCVKNCGKRFHLLVSQKDFILDLVKLIGPKNDPPTAVQEKVLSLIQSWADAFQNNPEMQGVVQVYHDLKQKGIEFPMTDLDTMAPIHTPQRSVPLTSTSPASHYGDQITHGNPALLTQPMPDVLPTILGSPLNLNSEQLAKLRSEFDIVQGNIKVFGDMLTEMTPGQEHPQDFELLQELQKTCYSMQGRIVDLLDKIGNEEVTSELLRLNDELNNIFLRYERYQKKRNAVLSVSESKPQVPLKLLSENPLDKPLIDFGENNDDCVQVPISKLANISMQDGHDIVAASSVSQDQPSTKSNSITDEFDMFAQSRNTSYDSNKAKGSNYDDNTNLDQIEDGLASYIQNKHKSETNTSNHNERENTTNTEFDRFLNERVSTGQVTNLSNIPTSAATSSMQHPLTTSVTNRRQIDKDDAENALFAL